MGCAAANMEGFPQEMESSLVNLVVQDKTK
jgi:hypothetical protein